MNNLNTVSITLNIPIDTSESDWETIAKIYKSLDGWDQDEIEPAWVFPNDLGMVTASSEPSGLLIEGEADYNYFIGWLTVLCSRLSLAIGREVIDVEY